MKVEVFDIAEILTTEFAPREIVWGPITRNSYTLLYGATGVGKSFFTLKLLLSIAKGERWLGFKPEGSYRSIMLDGEMDIHTQQKRVMQLTSMNELTFKGDTIKFLTMESFEQGFVPNISDPDSQRNYDVLFSKSDVVVIDNMNTTSYAKTQYDSEITQFNRIMPWISRMKKQGKAVILIHHTNKMGQQMGSILKEQIADNVIELEKIAHESDNLKFKVKFHKHRHTARIAPFNIECIFHDKGSEWLVSDSDSDSDNLIEDHLRAGKTFQEISAELGVSSSRISSVKKKISKEDGNVRW